MKTKIILALTLALVLMPAVMAANVRVLTLELEAARAGTFSLTSYGVNEGIVDESATGDYTLEIVDSSGAVLYTTGFDLEFLAYPSEYESLTPGQAQQRGGDIGSIEVDEITLSFNVPYSKDVASMRLNKNGAEVFTADLTTCNENGACEPAKAENFLSCSVDCAAASEDGYCDGIFDKKCDPDCTAQEREDKDTDCTCGNGVCDEREDSFYCAEDCGSPANMILYAAVGAGIVVLLVLALLIKKFFLKAPKSKKKE